MLITRTCRRCGVEFDATARNTQYCSDTCRREVNTEYARKWREKNREKHRAYMREYMRTGKVHTGG